MTPKVQAGFDPQAFAKEHNLVTAALYWYGAHGGFYSVTMWSKELGAFGALSINACVGDSLEAAIEDAVAALQKERNQRAAERARDRAGTIAALKQQIAELEAQR